jgi:hypothetical protein
MLFLLARGTELAFEHDVRYNRFGCQPKTQAFAGFARECRARPSSIAMRSHFRTATRF